MTSGNRKMFEAAGYDQEEMYFHKLNQELIEKKRGPSKNLPAIRNNVLEFKRPEAQSGPKQSSGGGRSKKAA